MGLDGPSREIIVEPAEQPAQLPEPREEPAPEREPAPQAPKREPEKVPA